MKHVDNPQLDIIPPSGIRQRVIDGCAVGDVFEVRRTYTAEEVAAF